MLLSLIESLTSKQANDVSESGFRGRKIVVAVS